MNVPVKVLDGLIFIAMSMVLLIVDDVPAVNVVSVAVSVAVMIFSFPTEKLLVLLTAISLRLFTIDTRIDSVKKRLRDAFARLLNTAEKI